ncbi:MAG: GNAT family N-acetyltransferase [Chloroflexi bacterium]|nr:GNAT family N-acetyltransferase [Chloroflexota bacterium]
MTTVDMRVVGGKLRPFDTFRDLGELAELIGAAFGDDLDISGRVALAEMRRYARLWPLNWFAHAVLLSGSPRTSGFVWIEDGHVVGNISLRRTFEWGGFLIGNVAVRPDWQGRGIGSALMEAALQELAARGAYWVGLEVRDDNLVARRLYDRFGFREVGRKLCMVRPTGSTDAPEPPTALRLRRGCHGDSIVLTQMMHASVPKGLRSFLELRDTDYRPSFERTLDRLIEGVRESWWVAEQDQSIVGGVRVVRERGRRLDRIEVLAAPESQGEVAATLVWKGTTALRRRICRPIETFLIEESGPLVQVFESAGFCRAQTLIQMRRNVGRHVAVSD